MYMYIHYMYRLLIRHAVSYMYALMYNICVNLHGSTLFANYLAYFASFICYTTCYCTKLDLPQLIG